MNRPHAEPVGVVLAGGAARRLGGDKAGALVDGRPLVEWVADALGAVVGDVVVCARSATRVPDVGVPVWREPAGGAPHPLAGLSFALARVGERGVLCCPVDLPFVSRELLVELLAAPGDVAVADGQPLLGRFGGSCAGALAAAAATGAPARATVAALSPTLIAVSDASRVLLNVNTLTDLERARGLARG